MSHSSLVETYISALNLTSVAIVGAGRQCRVITGEPAPGEPIAHRYFFKASHAELVLATIGPEGLSGRPAGTLVDAIERTAAMLGASYVTPTELRKAAAEQVAEITERVRASGQRGALKVWNTRYRQYRLSRVAKAEPAIPYSMFLEQVVIMPTVRQIAASGRAI
jgi:hypothetical protein